MKKLHFIAQSKGGVGKSLLMYLMALKNHHKENCLFVDMDASTFTSRRQLSFVDEDKLDTVSLLNERAAIQRDNLFVYLDKLSRSRYQEVYIDLGAPESEQLPALIEFDDVQLPLREFADDMDIEFHIVIGGAGAYNASVMVLPESENKASVLEKTADISKVCKVLLEKYEGYYLTEEAVHAVKAWKHTRLENPQLVHEAVNQSMQELLKNRKS